MINKWIGIGRLTKDVEMRYSQDGNAIASFSVACSESWKDKKTGEKKERVEFVRIVAFNRLAEICGEYLHKGKQVYIEGRLQTRSWEKDGVTRYSTEIVLEKMQMLGGKSENNSSGGTYAEQDNAYPDDDDSIPF